MQGLESYQVLTSQSEAKQVCKTACAKAQHEVPQRAMGAYTTRTTL